MPLNRASLSGFRHFSKLSFQLVDLISKTSGILESKLLRCLVHLGLKAHHESGEIVPFKLQGRSPLDFAIAAAEGVGFDVLFLHKEAAAALADGVNPYTDVVDVADSAPTAEPGDVISGYVYPPIAAVAYSIGEWAVSDPRYTSLAAWLAILAMIGVHSMRRRRHDGLLVMILLASLPGWPLVLRAAWTEPVSLAFLTAGFFLWRRTMPSGAGLGLALASKQYFVVTGPLLLLNRGRAGRKG